MPFELPSAAEKMSHKFILDALRDDEQTKPEPEADTIELPVLCGTSVEEPPVLPPLEETEIEAEAAGEATGPKPLSPLELEPGKKYFRIGEVSHVVGVEPYVLRYWESEFTGVKPVKSKSGQRVYSRRDVETLYFIRQLLHVEKFSIKGAKKRLQERRKEIASRPSPVEDKRRENLKGMVNDLKALIQVIKTDPGF